MPSALEWAQAKRAEGVPLEKVHAVLRQAGVFDESNQPVPGMASRDINDLLVSAQRKQGSVAQQTDAFVKAAQETGNASGVVDPAVAQAFDFREQQRRTLAGASTDSPGLAAKALFAPSGGVGEPAAALTGLIGPGRAVRGAIEQGAERGFLPPELTPAAAAEHWRNVALGKAGTTETMAPGQAQAAAETLGEPTTGEKIRSFFGSIPATALGAIAGGQLLRRRGGADLINTITGDEGRAVPPGGRSVRLPTAVSSVFDVLGTPQRVFVTPLAETIAGDRPGERWWQMMGNGFKLPSWSPGEPRDNATFVRRTLKELGYNPNSIPSVLTQVAASLADPIMAVGGPRTAKTLVAIEQATRDAKTGLAAIGMRGQILDQQTAAIAPRIAEAVRAAGDLGAARQPVRTLIADLVNDFAADRFYNRGPSWGEQGVLVGLPLLRGREETSYAGWKRIFNRSGALGAQPEVVSAQTLQNQRGPIRGGVAGAIVGGAGWGLPGAVVGGAAGAGVGKAAQLAQRNTALGAKVGEILMAGRRAWDPSAPPPGTEDRTAWGDYYRQRTIATAEAEHLQAVGSADVGGLAKEYSTIGSKEPVVALGTTETGEPRYETVRNPVRLSTLDLAEWKRDPVRAATAERERAMSDLNWPMRRATERWGPSKAAELLGVEGDGTLVPHPDLTGGKPLDFDSPESHVIRQAYSSAQVAVEKGASVKDAASGFADYVVAGLKGEGWADDAATGVAADLLDRVPGKLAVDGPEYTGVWRGMSGRLENLVQSHERIEKANRAMLAAKIAPHADRMAHDAGIKASNDFLMSKSVGLAERKHEATLGASIKAQVDHEARLAELTAAHDARSQDTQSRWQERIDRAQAAHDERVQALQSREATASEELRAIEAKRNARKGGIADLRDRLKLLGEHGLRPKRHALSYEKAQQFGEYVKNKAGFVRHPDDAVISVQAPQSAKQEAVLEGLSESGLGAKGETWVEVTPPDPKAGGYRVDPLRRGGHPQAPNDMPTDRRYFVQVSGRTDTAAETVGALHQQHGALTADLDETRRALAAIDAAPTKARVDDLTAKRDAALQRIDATHDAEAARLTNTHMQRMSRYVNRIAGGRTQMDTVRDAIAAGKDAAQKAHAEVMAKLGGTIDNHFTHIIRDREAIQRRIPYESMPGGPDFMKHRQFVDVIENVEHGQDPVTDLLITTHASIKATADAMAEWSVADLIAKDRRWAVPMKESEGLRAQAGWQPWSHPVTGEKYRVRQEVLKDFGRVIEGYKPGGLDALFEAVATAAPWLGKPMSGWKARATHGNFFRYNMRNILPDDVWRMWMGGYDGSPETAKEAFKIGLLGHLDETAVANEAAKAGRRKPDALENRLADGFRNILGKMASDGVVTQKGTGATATYQEAYTELAKRGVIDKGHVSAELSSPEAIAGTRGKRWSPAELGLKDLIPLHREHVVLGEGGFYLKTTGLGSRALENQRRLTAGLAAWKRGETWDEAAHNVGRWMFNFNERTDFLRRWAGPVSPFITFTSKAIPAHWTAMRQNPSRYMAFVNAGRAIEEQAESTLPPVAVVPDYIEDASGIRLPYQVPGTGGAPKADAFYSTGLSISEFNMLNPALPASPLGRTGFFDDVTPVVDMGAIMFAGRDPRTGRMISNEWMEPDASLKLAADAWNATAGRTNALKVPMLPQRRPDGTTYYKLPAATVMMWNKMLPNVIAATSAFFGKSDPFAEQRHPYDVGRFFTGQSIYVVNPLKAEGDALKKMNETIAPSVVGIENRR